MDMAVKTNMPNIVVLDKKEYRALIIDVTVPMDINMTKAAAGALRTISQTLDDLLAWVSPRANFDLIQIEVLLGSAHILCHILTDLVK
eukprot:3038198-Ditylum_brightwellii.AAC.2